jgi:hypothetical protein
MRGGHSPLEGLARKRAAGVTDDGSILGETPQDAPARVPDRFARRDTRQLLDRCVPGHDPQLLVDNEQRITRAIFLRLLHAYRCRYGDRTTTGFTRPKPARADLFPRQRDGSASTKD